MKTLEGALGNRSGTNTRLGTLKNDVLDKGLVGMSSEDEGAPRASRRARTFRSQVLGDAAHVGQKEPTMRR